MSDDHNAWGEPLLAVRRADPDDTAGFSEHALKLVGREWAQVRVPHQLTPRGAEIVKEWRRTGDQLAAIYSSSMSQDAKAMSAGAAIRACAARMRRIGKGGLK